MVAIDHQLLNHLLPHNPTHRKVHNRLVEIVNFPIQVNLVIVVQLRIRVTSINPRHLMVDQHLLNQFKYQLHHLFLRLLDQGLPTAHTLTPATHNRIEEHRHQHPLVAQLEDHQPHLPFLPCPSLLHRINLEVILGRSLPHRSLRVE